VSSAFAQAWPAFALVAGLLLIGAAAAREGLFAATGARVALAPGGSLGLLAGLLLVEALVTAVLNLDTAVVFMTPVLLHAARARGAGEAPFLYGAVFMANAASLLLPGSNLTNLIVLAHEHVAGATFAARVAPAWIVSVVLTIVVVAIAFRRDLRRSVRVAEEVAFTPGLGTAAVAVSAVLVLVLPRPALPVLALGIAVALLCHVSLRAANPWLLLSVFALAVLLGTLARNVHIGLLDGAGRWQTAGIAALASVLVNNLPAAMLLSAHVPAHPRALLVGLDLGPNLVVTGSLSAVLWWQVARANAARPAIVRYTKVGIVLAPLTIAASLLVLTRV
jgi:arsenical pump membrane protein